MQYLGATILNSSARSATDRPAKNGPFRRELLSQESRRNSALRLAFFRIGHSLQIRSYRFPAPGDGAALHLCPLLKVRFTDFYHRLLPNLRKPRNCLTQGFSRSRYGCRTTHEFEGGRAGMIEFTDPKHQAYQIDVIPSAMRDWRCCSAICLLSRLSRSTPTPTGPLSLNVPAEAEGKNRDRRGRARALGRRRG